MPLEYEAKSLDADVPALRRRLAALADGFAARFRPVGGAGGPPRPTPMRRAAFTLCEAGRRGFARARVNPEPRLRILRGGTA